MTNPRDELDQIRQRAEEDLRYAPSMRAKERMTWRTWLPHTRVQAGYRIVQIVGTHRWSLAIYIKPRSDR